jgi:transcriptional regulator with XRE-family HTH domain
MVKNIITIKNDLWTYRKKMGFSQKRAAYFLGMKKTNALSHYEHGNKLPGLINALKLEILYRTPVAFLFGNLYGRLKREIRKREERLQLKEGEE